VQRVNTHKKWIHGKDEMGQQKLNQPREKDIEPNQEKIQQNISCNSTFHICVDNLSVHHSYDWREKDVEFNIALTYMGFSGVLLYTEYRP